MGIKRLHIVDPHPGGGGGEGGDTISSFTVSSPVIGW